MIPNRTCHVIPKKIPKIQTLGDMISSLRQYHSWAFGNWHMDCCGCVAQASISGSAVVVHKLVSITVVVGIAQLPTHRIFSANTHLHDPKRTQEHRLTSPYSWQLAAGCVGLQTQTLTHTHTLKRFVLYTYICISYFVCIYVSFYIACGQFWICVNP